MADDKKDKKDKPESSGGGFGQEDLIVMLVFFAIAGSAIYNRVQSFLDSSSGGVDGIKDDLFERLLEIAPLFEVVTVSFSAIMLVWIFYFTRKIAKIRREEKVKLYPSYETTADDGIINPIVNKKWGRVTAHINSANQSDWKLAIIEADIMLDDLLDVLNYRGETLADKLKSIEESDFVTLDLAWEAHKVRNVIAHEGSDFQLNEREARRVIELYRSVFNEFKFI